MGGIKQRAKSFFNKRRVEASKVEKIKFEHVLRNGGVLLEKIISLSNGRQDFCIRRFTAEEITLVTNNFQECVMTRGDFIMFKGVLDDECSVLVYKPLIDPLNYDAFILGIAINALMSHLKYILKLIGCCMEFEFPTLVYEYAGSTNLSDFHKGSRSISDRTLSLYRMIKISRDIASMVVYFHGSFPLKLVHRNLHPFNVIVDQNGDAKLFNFTLAIAIPKGEPNVIDVPMGTLGFIDPEYLSTSSVSTKSDVYAFGVMLLEILTGDPLRLWKYQVSIDEYVKQLFDFDELIINEMFHEVGRAEFDEVKNLILSCIKEYGEDRPEMIDVARRLHRIEKDLKMKGQVL
ncbi:hypothetical protein Leryth_019912 [Lithospermum erythrorhizon]|nr:hypothetical protein Leryth_019912 [Lithospermum erythrorhizon]